MAGGVFGSNFLLGAVVALDRQLVVGMNPSGEAVPAATAVPTGAVYNPDYILTVVLWDVNNKILQAGKIGQSKIVKIKVEVPATSVVIPTKKDKDGRFSES